jgi:MFS family permease
MNHEIRKLTDGAMMAAIIGVLLLINRQTAGLLESLFIFAFPLPLVFYGAKYGWKSSWMVFAAVILLACILGTPQTIFYVASESLIGIVYGCGIHLHRSTRSLVLTTILMAVAADIASMLVFASFFGYDLASEVTAYQSSINQVISQTGTTAFANIDISSMIKTVIVVSTVLSGVMEGLATHLLSRLLLKRLRIDVEPLHSMKDYYPPRWTGYLGLAGFVMFCYSYTQTIPNETLMYFMQGAGLVGTFYLCFYAVLGMSMLLTPVFQSKAIAIVLSIGLLLFMSPVMALIGFLYISTNLHEKFMKGGMNDAA